MERMTSSIDAKLEEILSTVKVLLVAVDKVEE
jgi:hypothetical protein